MATKTPNINLNLTPASETTKAFETWRVGIDSDDPSSNMMIIDTEIQNLKNNKSDNTHTHTISQVGGINLNLLHNWDFRNTVNTKALASYSGINIDVIDRWLIVETSTAITVTSNYITLNGAIWQYLSRATSQVYGLQFTISVLVDNNVYSSAFTWGTTGEAKNGSFSGLSSVTWKITDRRIGLVTTSNVNIQAVKLEYGSVSTLTNEKTADRTLQDVLCQSVSGGGTVNSMPIGAIIMWSGQIVDIPSGWKLCDGVNGTPDLRGRFIVGAGSAYTVGNTGGVETVTLTSAQVPSHSHTITGSTSTDNISGTTSSSGAHTHPISVTGDSTQGGSNFQGSNSASYSTNNTQSAGAHTHTFSAEHSHNINATASSFGGGGSHENRPPYYALCYIMFKGALA